MALKKLDLSKKSFKGASGKQYFFEQDLNTKRFEQYEILQAEVGFGIDFQTLFTNWRKVYDLANETKFADIVVVAHNVMTGIDKKLNNRKNAALMMATLFINAKDEDRTAWNEELANEKIEDWREYDVQGFFSYALSLVSGYMEVYEKIIQSTLEMEIGNTNTLKKEEST